jgi:hypothetical protein
MGIVRDITIDQLTQAVNNIDTSTLAQDSTLQDVVTAISNISGGNDPVTNTTVNTLGKDTTLQSIAAAISALGLTLGSDRALIDGSNIGDKSTFRSNIEASGIIICENKSKTTGLPTFTPNSANVVTINLDKSGYTPFGIIEITGSGTTGLVLQEFYISNNVAYVYFRNLTSSNITPSLIRVRIIYFKD